VSCPAAPQLLVAGKLTPAADVYSFVLLCPVLRLTCVVSCCLLQLLVAGKLTPAADVYSFGIMSEWERLLGPAKRMLMCNEGGWESLVDVDGYVHDVIIGSACTAQQCCTAS
jgi:hypothetical protein